MGKREFFLRRPVLQFLPSFVVVGFCLIAAIVQLARGGLAFPDPNLQGDDFAAGFWTTFPYTFAVGFGLMAIIVLAILAYSAYHATRRPFLVLDAEFFAVPGLKLTWTSIGALTPGSNLGSPCLRVNTLNDKALIERVRFPLSLIYALRVRLYGAPIFIAPVKEVPLEELRELIETYRTSATA
jgi:hypothetical protein